MNFHLSFTKSFLFITFLFISQFAFAQSTTKWSLSGNATSSGDFFGTTNNNPVIFYANNAEWMRLKTNGDLKINSLSGTGNNFIFSNSSGVLFTKPCSSDTNKFMTEAGVFRTASSFTGWKFNGNNIHTITGSFVGIGTNNPQYQLDVAGDARLYGTLYAQGLILATKLQADTVKSTSMISINNNLSFFSGTVNDIYTVSGDVRLQSRVGYGGNTILNAGNNGNVGIGIYAPQYKFDVNGDARVNGKIYVHRIMSLPGDSEVHFGDSSIVLNYSRNVIYTNTAYIAPNATPVRGLAIGSIASISYGQNSVVIGQKLTTTAASNNSIVIGSGVIPGSGYLTNTIPYSMMVGFNSTLPTLFVGPASGANTIGKIGIGTTNPLAEFQMNDGINRLNMGTAPANTFGILGYMGFNAELNSSSYMHTTGNGTTNSGGVISFSTDGSMRFNVLQNVTGGNDLTQDPAHFAANSQMRIYNSHVEIGADAIRQTSPYFNDVNTKLTVSGRIICKDVVVSIVDWPDFVFDSTYSLMPLDTMSNYLKSNKHLPQSVPASTVEQNGMSVSETTKALQQQTEEMMLYILQLNERLKALETENAQLKANGGK